ncbi:MAG: hypothetical protein KDC85_09560 [Saprospiraceae bacterium]|nr:hypothetical protein [Saprospiraceae bacterium]MCB9322958.1 hypothetical protein [Lewinellaceae bacterium]
MKDHNDTKNHNAPLSDNSFMIDSDLLPLFDKAENGCLSSQIKLAVAFCEGEGAKKNEALARKFEKLMFDTTDDYRFKLAALWNPAIRAHERGDLEDMKAYFHKVIDFMQENVPMEKWDFSLFEVMEKLTQGKE